MALVAAGVPGDHRAIPRRDESRIEPALVWAIMREESSFRPSVTSSAGAMGLLQLMPETARRTADRSGYGEFEVEALYTPETNITLGAAYLDHLAGRFPGRLSAAIGSYNAGPLAVARWLEGDAAELEDDVWVEDIPYTQTQQLREARAPELPRLPQLLLRLLRRSRAIGRANRATRCARFASSRSRCRRYGDLVR